ncbi:bifunctional DNA primase/polymerase [Tsukamurella soli]|uniref:bifunctional DNA primase/polymerase n=1 Tax=Tsukamurella soli TaxID=644556 RepID=UPI00362363CC
MRARDRVEVEPWVDLYMLLGAHLLPLSPGTKKPVNQGWPDARAMTRDDAISWLARGGGIGINLGKSGWICFDADNAGAAELFRRAGLVRTVIPANAQVPNHPQGKTGGGHFVALAPEGFDPDTLHSRPFGLPTGEKGDALGGRRFIVGVPTRLDEAGGRMYLPDPAGQWGTGAELPRAGAWVADAGAEGCPAGLEALRGLLGPRTARERVLDADGDGRTERQHQIDEIGWDQVIGGDPRMIARGADSCGCDLYEWGPQSGDRGATLHDGCAWGFGVHVWSGTMQTQLQLDGEHTDRLRLAARLRGLDLDGEVALGREWGVEFGGLRPFTDDLDALADRAEERAEDPAACAGAIKGPDPTEVPHLAVLDDGAHARKTKRWVQMPADREYWLREAGACRGLARMLRGGPAAGMQQAAETLVTGPVVGAPQPVPAQPVAPAASAEVVDAEVVDVPQAAPPSETSENALAVDDAVEGELVEDWEDGDPGMWLRHRQIEEALRGTRDPETGLWIGMTPALGRMANLAESEGVYLLGFIESVLPRVSARVPARVVIAPRNGLTTDKVRGVSLSYNALLFGPPATAKTTTQTAAAAAVPLPEGIAIVPQGTAEGIVKAARKTVGKRNGPPEQIICATSVYVETDEVKSVDAELARDASKYVSFTNSTFFGNTTVGQTASEAARNAQVPPHGARFAQQIAAQPQLCGRIWTQAGSGLDARFACAFAGSVAPRDRGPLYGTTAPPLLPNGLPWDRPVGLPFGFRPTGQTIENEDGTSTPVLEADPPEDHPAEWVLWPEGSLVGAEAAAQKAADRSRHTRAAMLHDLETSRTEGHEGVRTMKTSALLAFLDGVKQPKAVHWRAAELLAEATVLAATESVEQSERYDDEQAKKTGRKKGKELAHGKVATEQTVSDAVRAAAEAVYGKLTRPREGVLVRGSSPRGSAAPRPLRRSPRRR